MLLVPVLLLTAAGCGFFSSDSPPLPGVYETEEFRIQTAAGERFDVGEAGAFLEMTLREDGTVEGTLRVPAGAGVGARAEETFTGTYQRSGQRVTFDFNGEALSEDFGTGTPLAQVAWIFFEEDDGRLVADAEGYVLFLERVRALDEE